LYRPQQQVPDPDRCDRAPPDGWLADCPPALPQRRPCVARSGGRARDGRHASGWRRWPGAPGHRAAPVGRRWRVCAASGTARQRRRRHTPPGRCLTEGRAVPVAPPQRRCHL